MSAIEWNKKEDLLQDQALRHLKQYTTLFAAFATTTKSEIVLLNKIQEYCYENMNFLKSFNKIVLLLYKSKYFRDFLSRTRYNRMNFLLWDFLWKVDLMTWFVKIEYFSKCSISTVSYWNFLISADVLSEDAVLKWYKESHSQRGWSVFADQMKKFVEWLEHAEEGKNYFWYSYYSIRIEIFHLNHGYKSTQNDF